MNTHFIQPASRFKRFKRKVAKLFGLALRSDLEGATNAFNIRDRMASMYWNDICDLVLDETPQDKKIDLTLKYKAEIDFNKKIMDEMLNPKYD